jgi:hypothetical protein
MSEDFASLGLTHGPGEGGHLLKISQRLKKENNSDSGRSGFKTPRHVDLFNDPDPSTDAEGGDSSQKKPATDKKEEPATDDLSLSSKTLQKHKADPLSFAMNEINLARKNQGLEGENVQKTNPPKKTASSLAEELKSEESPTEKQQATEKDSPGSLSSPFDTEKKSSASLFRSPLAQTSGLPWYQLVPTWFWCLIIAGGILLVFTSITTILSILH